MIARFDYTKSSFYVMSRLHEKTLMQGSGQGLVETEKECEICEGKIYRGKFYGTGGKIVEGKSMAGKFIAGKCVGRGRIILL